LLKSVDFTMDEQVKAFLIRSPQNSVPNFRDGKGTINSNIQELQDSWFGVTLLNLCVTQNLTQKIPEKKKKAFSILIVKIKILAGVNNAEGNAISCEAKHRNPKTN
jgi:hypothetical protein